MELVDRLDNVVGKRLVDVERQVSYLGRVVPDPLQLAGAGVVVETLLAGGAEFLGRLRRPEGRPEDPRDNEPEAVEVVVPPDHVACEVVVALGERRWRLRASTARSGASA